MGTEQRIEAIQEFLTTTADERFINLVFSMVQTEISQCPIDPEQYNRELDEAEAEIDHLGYYTQDEVERRSKTW